MSSSSSDRSEQAPHTTGEGNGPEGASSDEPPDEPDPTTCPNCGREFRGRYCPDCGQEADRSVGMDDVAGSFVRELADVEGGLWATFKGLTLRPGDTLRAYLQGARAQFISPGRYLLVSILVSFAVFRGLIWLGGLERFQDAAGSRGMNGGEADQALMEAMGQATQSQWWTTAITLVSVGLLALIFRRVFREEMREWAAALATSAFLGGHASLLTSAAILLHAVGVSVATGQPADIPMISVYSLLITPLYVGTAAYAFAPDWRNAVKGGLGAFWVTIEAGCIGSLLLIGYLLLFVRPPAELSAEGTAFLAVTSGLYATPLLLHTVAEVYYSLR